MLLTYNTVPVSQKTAICVTTMFHSRLCVVDWVTQFLVCCVIYVVGSDRLEQVVTSTKCIDQKRCLLASLEIAINLCYVRFGILFAGISTPNIKQDPP